MSRRPLPCAPAPRPASGLAARPGSPAGRRCSWWSPAARGLSAGRAQAGGMSQQLLPSQWRHTTAWLGPGHGAGARNNSGQQAVFAASSPVQGGGPPSAGCAPRVLGSSGAAPAAAALVSAAGAAAAGPAALAFAPGSSTPGRSPEMPPSALIRLLFGAGLGGGGACSSARRAPRCRPALQAATAAVVSGWRRRRGWATGVTESLFSIPQARLSVVHCQGCSCSTPGAAARPRGLQRRLPAAGGALPEAATGGAAIGGELCWLEQCKQSACGRPSFCISCSPLGRAPKGRLRPLACTLRFIGGIVQSQSLRVRRSGLCEHARPSTRALSFPAQFRTPAYK